MCSDCCIICLSITLLRLLTTYDKLYQAKIIILNSEIRTRFSGTDWQSPMTAMVTIMGKEVRVQLAPRRYGLVIKILQCKRKIKWPWIIWLQIWIGKSWIILGAYWNILKFLILKNLIKVGRFLNAHKIKSNGILVGI